jgi:hypothetical protein
MIGRERPEGLEYDVALATPGSQLGVEIGSRVEAILDNRWADSGLGVNDLEGLQCGVRDA